MDSIPSIFIYIIFLLLIKKSYIKEYTTYYNLIEQLDNFLNKKLCT